MGYAPIATLIGFVLFNIVSHTVFRLSDFQSAVVMLITWLSAAKIFGEKFPDLFQSDRTVERTKSGEVHQPVTSDVPEWGTVEYAIVNPRAGQGE